ncbi:MAG: penicillin acylase family protein [Blastocatellia bacterium]|nr:penicillin acylase family protein [Blastocatellia bacterium]MCS7158378.1 penicillin acylase family protein [Blastocatellia bacterium]MCX7752884.1 penicillin acylase family protein [Blastocatellia bacterium]MDW8167940.1 penicillin acylase family protein [Acidobacteriota bacterium]MDW8255965.1 penicillin acylase family protein [Acidobacteriota bacterium]
MTHARWLRWAILGLLLLPPVGSGASSQSAARRASALIYRDDFGVPHIFAPDVETAAYAVGYAQAEDRLEELLKNYRRATGTMAEAFGPEFFRQDYEQRLWRHAEVSRANYHRLTPKTRAVIEAFIEGVKAYMREHPEKVPAWAPEIQPWHVVALGRFIIFGWPVGEALADLRRVGITPDVPSGLPAELRNLWGRSPSSFDLADRGSNAMLIAPWRTAMRAPIAIIDPHLSWYGEFRFYQLRIYAGTLAVAGVAILGTPLPALGHSAHCSIAMTTGGPDTADVYEEEVNPENPRQYRYDGEWRPMRVRAERIGVRRGDRVEWVTIEIEETHHGPIIARLGHKAYAVALPYAEEVELMDQIFEMLMARDVEEMKRALARLQLMAQNVLIACTSGDLYYARVGRVPIRPDGVDPSRPIPGHTAATEWRGIHPFSDLVQLQNPPSGYMHNCNVTPFAMMRESPLVPERYIPYIYNASRTAPRHQRGERVTELLDAATRVTEEQALALAFDTGVWHAELWQARVREAWERAPESAKSPEVAIVYELIQRWNRRSDPDSEGALAFYAFKKALGPMLAPRVDPPPTVTDAELLEALARAAKWLRATFGSLRVPYGRYFRVGREGGTRTWPVGGGSLNREPNNVGMATPRAITFVPAGEVMLGRAGQSATHVVILTKPPRSYSVVPLGHSDDPKSPHWDDQAEKLFSRGRAAPTYFLRRGELLKHVTARKVVRRTMRRPRG